MGGMTLRRLRSSEHIRSMVQEIRLAPAQFLQPLFVVEGLREREPVAGLAGVFRETSDSLARQVEADLRGGVQRFLLFGVPEHKALEHFDPAFTAGQVAELRRRFGQEVWIATDVCLCSHTEHGHCGILDATGGRVLNEPTVETLAHHARVYAEAGADCVAPSDMMDGRVGAIRQSLAGAGLEQVLLMSYAAKFHSGFYGPFREAADSAPGAEATLKDRATYQIDPARPSDALLSARRDHEEGADILMVKPGLPYLDILAKLSAEISAPWAVYQTSGEQASLETLAAADLADLDRLQLETWHAMARAGARIIVSYAARRASSLLS